LAWLLIAIGIGLSIATTALTSRAFGARNTELARQTALSSVLIVAMVMVVVSMTTLFCLDGLLGLIGAQGETKRLALRFLWMVTPSIPLVAIGMSLGGLLRAVGDPRRAMWVTLGPAAVIAMLDPLLIYGLEMGLDGAAVGVILARLLMVTIGFYCVTKIHSILDLRSLVDPQQSSLLWQRIKNLRPAYFAIAAPAVLTQIASPVATAVTTWIVADFGDDGVAGWAVIGRLTTVAFGVIFALSGSIGSIIGQNFGAKRIDRVRSTLIDSFKVTVLYCLAMSVVLALLAKPIAGAFGLTGSGFELVVFFCRFLAVTFVFQGIMFVANAGFNNLGFPTYSSWLNWGRATLGVVPFAMLGGALAGAQGAIIGYSLGGVLFGLIAWLFMNKVLLKLSH
ncbi:MAG: MATE family efflux transporter, partial [Alphaproteobacteria bacterium]